MNLEGLMRRAMRLAERGRGASGTNPLVGAVVARAERIVGEGWYAAFGGPHAEASALARAGRAARGATLAVTVEPCGTAGKTPPCSRMIVASGISRVAIGCPDPSQRGRGIAEMRKSGIAVTRGILEPEIKKQNEDFFSSRTRRMPVLSLKLAMTMDGRIADRRGVSKWISSAGARRWTRRLRDRADALMVGIGTVLADDPRLGGVLRRPLRVIVDSRARTPAAARLLVRGRTLIAAAAGAPADRIAALEGRGAEVLAVRGSKRSVSLSGLMRTLYLRGVGSVLCEGGGKLAGALLEAGLVTRLYAVVAPRLLADERARPAAAGRGRLLGSSIEMRLSRQERLGPDLLVEAVPVRLRE